jgi:hypothetical protein
MISPTTATCRSIPAAGRFQPGERQIKNTENALVTGIGWINYGRNWGTSAALMLVPNG